MSSPSPLSAIPPPDSTYSATTSSDQTQTQFNQQQQGIEVYRDYEGLQAVAPDAQQHYAPDDHTQKQVAPAGAPAEVKEDKYLQPIWPGAQPPSNASELPPAEGAHGAAAAAAAGAGAAGGKKDTILGLRRRTFLIVTCVIMAIVVGAIVGGVVGGVLGSDNSSSSGSPSTSSSTATPTTSTPPSSSSTAASSTTAPPVAVLDDSKLAAANWTDSNSIEHRLVFFQDGDSNLIARHGNSSTSPTIWNTINLTAAVDQPSTVTPADSGSFLAAAAYTYVNAVGINLFYQSSGRAVHNLRTNDDSGETGWDEYNFGLSDADADRPTVSYRTAMGATFQYAGGAGTGTEIDEQPGYVLLTVVDEEGGLSMYNGTTDDSSWYHRQLNGSSDIAENTPVAMLPFRFQRQESVNYLFELPNWDLDHVGTIDGGEFAERSDLMTLEPPSTSGIVSQLAGLKFGGGDAEMILSLQSNGTVKAFYWYAPNWNKDSHQDTYNPATFDGYDDADPTWSAIATTGDGWFYGLSSDGRIVEFQNRQEDSDYGLFRYTSTVV